DDIPGLVACGPPVETTNNNGDKAKEPDRYELESYESLVDPKENEWTTVESKFLTRLRRSQDLGPGIPLYMHRKWDSIYQRMLSGSLRITGNDASTSSSETGCVTAADTGRSLREMMEADMKERSLIGGISGLNEEKGKSPAEPEMEDLGEMSEKSSKREEDNNNIINNKKTTVLPSNGEGSSSSNPQPTTAAAQSKSTLAAPDPSSSSSSPATAPPPTSSSAAPDPSSSPPAPAPTVSPSIPYPFFCDIIILDKDTMICQRISAAALKADGLRSLSTAEDVELRLFEEGQPNPEPKPEPKRTGEGLSLFYLWKDVLHTVLQGGGDFLSS
ncbi:hypothetical protein B0T20DRAFT_493841, partial [Sordaria brevicollis]